MPHLNEQFEAWIGSVVTDASGQKIGKIDDVYTDDETGQPEWLRVVTGLMGSGTHFVPVRGATSSGGGVQVPFPKDRVKLAPSAGGDGRLSRMEKGRLYAHYGYSSAEERNRLQLSLDAHRLDLRGAAAEREASRPVDLREVARPPDVSPPPHRRPEVAEEPAVVHGEGRGRWPDDEAIFGLIQDFDPAGGLATSGGSRRR